MSQQTDLPREDTDEPDVPVGHGTPVRRALAFARNTWRGLTSMRTALVLLFLLALAAMPGALLPQRVLNPPRTADWISAHGWVGTLLDRLQFFNVYGSVWFSSVYLLLFVSLVGCLVPRTWDYAKAARARPVLTPRNLRRLPHHVESTVDSSVDEVLTAAAGRLRGWRLVTREEDGGARSISAERGYLREAGNLVFHFALLGLVVAFALGKMYAYEGQVIVVEGDGFCNTLTQFDSFQPGLRVDGSDLDQFCVRVDDFKADYLPSGQAQSFVSHIQYSSGADLATNTWRPYDLAVNSPLRTVGDRLYLLGHGYAPVFTVTYPNGEKRTQQVQWLLVDNQTLLSQGTTKFDPPGVTDEATRRRNQLAVTGLFAPTAVLHGTILDSGYPAPNDPAVAVDVLRGDLGLDNGKGQSIFTIDQSMVDSGRLARVARQNLRPGQSITLDDGTVVSFDAVKQWVSLQVSHDPTQLWVLGFAVAVLLGLGTSLTIKRRRLWVRATPKAGEDGVIRTVVQVGGLARTDQAGYGEEFRRIAGELTRGGSDHARQ